MSLLGNVFRWKQTVLIQYLPASSFRRWRTCGGSVWNKGNIGFGEREGLPALVAPPALVSWIYEQRRYAGHSKWQNIKHIKAAKDSERSIQTVRFVNMLKIAIKEGGGNTDPKLNSKVAQVIEQIKDAKLSLAPFERTLEREATRKAEKHQTLLLRGPGNCILVVEISSDSLNRAKQEINTIMKKNKATYGDDSLLHLFEHKGVILSNELNGKAAVEDNLDDVIADAIDAGADDVTFQSDHPDFGNVYEFTTSPEAFYRVKHALEKKKHTIVSGEVEYIPTSPIELDDTTMQDVQKLYEKLTENSNVVKVALNVA